MCMHFGVLGLRDRMQRTEARDRRHAHMTTTPYVVTATEYLWPAETTSVDPIPQQHTCTIRLSAHFCNRLVANTTMCVMPDLGAGRGQPSLISALQYPTFSG
jgi:hypothetical protein